MRFGSFAVVLILGLVAIAGCLSPEDSDDDENRQARSVLLTVQDADSGDAVPLAQVTGLLDAAPVFVASTAKNGTVALRLGAAVEEIAVQAPGYEPKTHPARTSGPLTVELDPVSGEGPQEALALDFKPPLDLGSQTYPLAVGTACMEDPPNTDCGLGEPSIEVDARGTIYLSGVCCIGAAPPVLVSRDDGESFQQMETATGVREAFGIEGDFAIDDEGVMYFVDIELAGTFQTTAWDHEGEFLHHSKWPAPPLVDRPWLRAEGDGELYYVYNTGSETNVYTSEDGGETWSPAPRVSLPYALGNPVKAYSDGELWVIGGNEDGFRRADFTLDGGETWEMETTTSPSGGAFPVGYFDAAGNVYLVANEDRTLTVAKRDTGGSWHEAVELTPSWGTHRLPWIAAGDEGHVAVAWYGTMDDDPDSGSEWFLFVAVSLDAHEDDPHWAIAKADPVPVFVGDLQRELLDFLQVEIGPDDAVHVGYSKVLEAGEHEQLHYVQSHRSLPLSASTYPWGPRE